MGYIYKISNTINSQLYIGKTSNSLSKRWNEHLSSSKDCTINSKLYNAMRKYGSDKFKIDILEECNNEVLNQKEIEYIRKYDTFKNGYNMTMGGEGQAVIEYDKSKIIEMFNKGMSLNSIKRELGVNGRAVNYIIKDSLKEIAFENECKRLMLYDIEFKPIGYFQSILSAMNWVKDNTEYNVGTREFYRRIHDVCKNLGVGYGYRWQYINDISYKEMIFRTHKDLEMYLNGCKCTKINNMYQCCTLEELGIKYYRKCNKCGALTSNGKIVCNKCSKTYRDNTENRPSREELANLINMYSYEYIGKLYNVSGKAVKKWCDKYGIYKVKEINFNKVMRHMK